MAIASQTQRRQSLLHTACGPSPGSASPRYARIRCPQHLSTGDVSGNTDAENIAQPKIKDELLSASVNQCRLPSADAGASINSIGYRQKLRNRTSCKALVTVLVSAPPGVAFLHSRLNDHVPNLAGDGEANPTMLLPRLARCFLLECQSCRDVCVDVVGVLGIEQYMPAR